MRNGMIGEPIGIQEILASTKVEHTNQCSSKDLFTLSEEINKAAQQLKEEEDIKRAYNEHMKYLKFLSEKGALKQVNICLQPNDSEETSSRCIAEITHEVIPDKDDVAPDFRKIYEGYNDMKIKYPHRVSVSSDDNWGKSFDIMSLNCDILITRRQNES